jgi:hypothetical protein
VAENPAGIARNRDKNSKFFEFDAKIIEFCPKYANFAQNQGINRDFCGFLRKPLSAEQLTPFPKRFKKITGKYQGTFAA